MAIVAVAWMAFSVVILAFPTAPAPDAQGMNYMIVVIGGWIVLCLVYYHVPVYGGACWFDGPQVTVEHAAWRGGDEGDSEGGDGDSRARKGEKTGGEEQGEI